MARGILRPWDIARALGVHGNTVKTRLAEMRELGVVRGVYLAPFVNLAPDAQIGVFWFHFDGPKEKLAGIERVKAERDINDVHTYVGDLVRVAVMARAGEAIEEAGKRMRAVLGARSAELFYLRAAPHRGLDRLTALDLRVLMALVHDAHRPFADVGEEVGVTAKTVRLRFSNMLKLGAFAIIPHLDLGRMTDFVGFELDVEFEGPPDPPRNAAFLAGFPEAFYRSVPASSNAYMYLAARTTGEIEDYVLRAQDHPGVRRARALLVRETWTNNDNIVAFIRDRVEAMEAGAERGVPPRRAGSVS